MKMEKREATSFETFVVIQGALTITILLGISFIIFSQYGFVAGMLNIAAITGFLYISLYLEDIRTKLEMILEKEEQEKTEILLSEENETSLAEKN